MIMDDNITGNNAAEEAHNAAATNLDSYLPDVWPASTSARLPPTSRLRRSRMKKPKSIAYPLARDAEGNIIPISDAKHKVQYACVGCGNPMIPKMGARNKHHFAHKTDCACAPDNALHETSKAHIIRRFEDARETGGGCIMKALCSTCGKQTIEYDLTDGGASIKPEASAIEGTRSDLAVFESDGVTPRAIIEVAVTHDLEPNTRTAYLKSGVPVIIVLPSWTNLSNVRDTMNMMCVTCTTRARDLEHLMPDAPRDSGAPPLENIIEDKYARSLSSALRMQVNDYALRLSRCGFVQQPSRPTLFLHETADWKVYADLDSTKDLAIWESGGIPALYAYAKPRGRDERECRPDCRECVLEAARERVERAGGVETRRHFNDTPRHSH